MQSSSITGRFILTASLGLAACVAATLLAAAAGASGPLEVATAIIVALSIALHDAHRRRVALEARMAEEVRERSERVQYFVQRLIDVIPESVYVKDADGYYLMINQALCQQRGQAAREILGQSVRELSDDPERVAMVTQEDAAVIKGRRVFKEETYLHPFTGETRFRLISKGTCLDAAGQPVIVGTNFDITEWRRAEQKVQAALDVQARIGAFLQTVFDALPNPLFVKDAEHRYIMTNQALAATLGVSALELVGKRAGDVLPAELATRIEQHERQLLAQRDGMVGEVEFDYTDAEDRPRASIVRAVVSRDLENHRVIIGVVTDITERKAFEEEVRNHRDRLSEQVKAQTAGLLLAKEVAERSCEAKSQFLANMSHELRTPMHAILSFARIGESHTMSGTPECAKLHGYFERIAHSGERLLSLLNNLLDLSKLEAGRAVITLQPVSLRAIVEDALLEFEAWLLAKRMQLVQHFHCEHDVAGDPTRLGQVVRNLLSNAIKFSPEGTTITLAMRDAVLAAGRRSNDDFAIPAVELTIADEGVGIPPAELESVFDKFVQSSKTANGAGGTGLGLAICREIVFAHRGQIFARNRDEGGAEFVVRIPKSASAAL